MHLPPVLRRALAASAILLAGCVDLQHTSPLDIDRQKDAKLELNQIITVANSRKLGKVEFESDSAKLTESSSDFLDKIVELMRRYPRVKLVIAGHTDDVGSFEYNDRLSYERAKSVKTYLTRMGVLPETVRIYGYGKRRSLTKDTSDEGRAINRRVEFTVVDHDWETVY